MKTNPDHTDRRLFGPVIRTAIILSLVVSCSFAQAQSSVDIYPAFGLGFGFFYPGDVNAYLEDYYSTYAQEYGTFDMFMYFELHAALALKIKRIEVSGLFEFAFAPKYVVVTGGDNNTFFFNRVSPGLTAYYFIPIGSGRHAIILGGGFQYHFMKFEDYKGSAPGFRIQGGINLVFGKFNLQPYGAFVYASAKDTGTPGQDDFGLNYTGGQVGVNLSFHSRDEKK
jgi:hypothetical protein